MSSVLLAMLLRLGVTDLEADCRPRVEGSLHPIEQVGPGLPVDPHWGRLFAGNMYAKGSSDAFTLVGERRPPAITLPLMLPPPLKGTVTVTVQPLAVRPGWWCASVDGELSDDGGISQLRLGLPATLRVRIQRGSRLVADRTVRVPELRLTPYSVEGPGDESAAYVGDPEKIGDDFALTHPSFRKFLDAAGVKPAEALRSTLGRGWNRALLALVLNDLEETGTGPGWRPGADHATERLLLDLDPARFSGAQRRALGYWKATFAPPGKGAPALGSATLVPSEKGVEAVAVSGRVLAMNGPEPIRVEVPPGRMLRLQVVYGADSASGHLVFVEDAWAALAPGSSYALYGDQLLLQGRDPGIPVRDCVSVTFEGEPDATWNLLAGEEPFRSGQVVAPPNWPRLRHINLQQGNNDLPPHEVSYHPTHDGTYAFTVQRSGAIAVSFEPDRAPCRPP